MNLWFRLLGYLLTVWLRPRLTPPRESSRLRFRVWPSDVDMNLHMTNARFLAVSDFGRIDLIVRTGLFRIAMKRRWAPIVSYAAVVFRKELKLWRSLELETRLAYWDESVTVFEHCIRHRSGADKGAVAALALSAAALYDRRNRRFVSVDEMQTAVGLPEIVPSPPLTPEIEAFLAAQQAFKEAAAQVPRESTDPT